MALLGNALPEDRDPRTPDEVIVNNEPRRPVSDPTLGIPVRIAPENGMPQNRLVTIGDSLTHGFQSGAIFNTRLSWPMQVASELGCGDTFRYPLYNAFGGLPLNIEYVVRALEQKYGHHIDWWELPFATFELRHLMDEIEDYWERGAGATVPNTTGIMHNLAVYGWDVRDVLSRTPANLRTLITAPKDDLFTQIVANANARAALRVYAGLKDNETVLDAARRLGSQGAVPGSGGDAVTSGIETLIVFLGANNALGTVTSLKVQWSQTGYDQLGQKDRFTIWRPAHFASEWTALVHQLKTIKAQHVIVTTVPHVTIAPITRGVGSDKVRKGSRYFPYYTRPWIDDPRFGPGDLRLTENEARAIDSAIDQYNETIVATVRETRNANLDWLVLDIAGLLDRLAARRYIEDISARPDWWTEYELPPELKALLPKVDSKFFGAGPEGRTQGGLFSLDGIHPTTVGYGIIAQEFINVMQQQAGVKFFYRNGAQRTEPVRIDFARLLHLDSLMSAPPASFSSDLHLVGWLDEAADIIGKLNPFN